MSLNIQDPSYDKSKYLHEALISACVGKKLEAVHMRLLLKME